MSERSSVVDGTNYPNLDALLALQYSVTPQHRRYLEARMGEANGDFAFLETLSTQILALGGERMREICANYDFICSIVREEEIYFRRNGNYRLTTFEEANRLVYSDKAFMGRYMDGLLLTQVYWSNHSASYAFYKNEFLAKAVEGYDYLEIGPGHGLLLYQAISDDRNGSVSGWDVSKTSIEQTFEALETLGLHGKKVDLALRDLYAPRQDEKLFDCVTFSEVLEHLEKPQLALESLLQILKPGGRLYVNVPINSPAPDHLYLLRSPDEVLDAIRTAGFEIETSAFYPMTNHTMAQALKHRLTISACVIARRPVKD
ncbi:class I SAM-dependent methyltransferase [Rhizobium leguminosarum]|uniref:Uncharacterized protein n=1 Tax=Rhizobium leguminosarum TaxID=384 RepID=A0A2K9YY18_RHILE|nr:methyltransferase domain-containing protein [Rhizobium leguminosarum]AUW40888.1 hypothetical protein CUJ84_Chr000474 [Rhizobium leguminosarum]